MNELLKKYDKPFVAWTMLGGLALAGVTVGLLPLLRELSRQSHRNDQPRPPWERG